ncbi:hypothetical protein CJ030_MR6G004320 [Morella rubra]|uniref:Uncharacterized protein n=1 Tax=Morella rubra TaxID=262757 RepID=A0A6A1VG58_9ROSI|nr:hypothetical protein CJ030_MR6G004320 [Morella rubra]
MYSQSQRFGYMCSVAQDRIRRKSNENQFTKRRLLCQTILQLWAPVIEEKAKAIQNCFKLCSKMDWKLPISVLVSTFSKRNGPGGINVNHLCLLWLPPPKICLINTQSW